MPKLLEGIGAGNIRPDAIVTRTLDLEDAVHGYEVFSEKREDFRTVILCPGVFPPEGVRA